MNQRILIVEDQFLIAIAIEDAILALGHHVTGIAATCPDAIKHSEMADIALVDINLADGPTGPAIGRELAKKGCTVIFMTANPEAVAGGIDGVIGVISKPVRDLDLVGVIQYASALRQGEILPAPTSLKLFA